MVALRSEPDGNDLERSKDSCASQSKDEEHGQSGRRDMLPENLARPSIFTEKQFLDDLQPEISVCAIRNPSRKKAGR